MSYDYLFFNHTADESPTMEAIEFAGGMGTVEEVKTQISAVLPSIIWQELKIAPGVYFGLQGPPEFQVSAEEEGQVYNFTASYIEAHEVETLAKHMSLVALDLPTEQFLGV